MEYNAKAGENHMVNTVGGNGGKRQKRKEVLIAGTTS